MLSFPLRRSIAVAFVAIVVCLPLASPAIAEDGPSLSLIWPTSGRISQPYGCTGFWAEPRRGSCAHFHGGIDIANSRGTPVVAAADGTVDLVGWDPWIRPNPDWMVIIDHGNGMQTMYAHLRAKPVAGITRGARVHQGQLIGLMDMTGRATGPHLHFSVISDGHWVNPRRYLDGSLRHPVRNPPQPLSCESLPSSGGVGAWLGGTTAIVPAAPGGCQA